MSSPSIKTARASESSNEIKENIYSMSYCDKKIYFLYAIIVFTLLLICRPSFIMKKEGLLEKEKNISYSKLIIWEIILCFPLFFYYVINY
jgi:hypothetical protein